MPRLGTTFLLLGALAASTVSTARETLDPAAARALETLPERMLPGLDEVLARAATDAPRLVQRRLDLLVAEENAKISRAPTLPRVSASGDAYVRQEVRSDIAGSLTAFKYFYSLRAEQPLFHWGALMNEKRLGEIRLALAGRDFDTARAGLVREIRAAYAGLILRALDLEQAEQAQARDERRLAADDARAARGEIAPTALADLRADVDLARLRLDRARLDLRRAREEFVLLAGGGEATAAAVAPGRLPTEIAALPDGVEIGEDAWSVARADAGAPAGGAAVPVALQRELGELEAARLAYDIERVRLRPKVNLVAGLGQDEVSYTANIAQKVNVETRYIGVAVRWDIFDGWAAKAATQRARIAVRAREQALRDAESALDRRLRAEREDLALLRREQALAEKRFADGAARFEAEKARRDAGRLALNDWELLAATREAERVAVLRGRVALVLRLADYAALLRETTTPASLATDGQPTDARPTSTTKLSTP